jgi:hypothetical protein
MLSVDREVYSILSQKASNDFCLIIKYVPLAFTVQGDIKLSLIVGKTLIFLIDRYYPQINPHVVHN